MTVGRKWKETIERRIILLPRVSEVKYISFCPLIIKQQNLVSSHTLYHNKKQFTHTYNTYIQLIK